MKAILYSAVMGSLALALTAGEAQAATDENKRQERSRPQHRAATIQPARPAAAGATRSARSYNSTAQAPQRAYMAPRMNSAVNSSARTASARQATVRERTAVTDSRAARPASRPTATVNRTRNIDTNRERNVTANRVTRSAATIPGTTRERNVARNANEFRNPRPTSATSATVVNRNVTVNRTQNAAFYRGRNVTITNNWRTDAFRGQRYWAFHNYNRQWHDRHWWRSHYDRIIFVNNGWWYWNAGYWFPAWGYAPYVSYVYDGPIYAYNGLSPDQVTVNVQEQLAATGYYDGPIDGVLGPMTREAIAAYQADNGLAVTSAIDEPTLATMGLV